MKIKRRGDEPRAFCSKSFDGYYFFAAFFAGFLAGAFFAQAFLQQHFFAATFFAGAFLTATFLVAMMFDPFFVRSGVAADVKYIIFKNGKVEPRIGEGTGGHLVTAVIWYNSAKTRIGCGCGTARLLSRQKCRVTTDAAPVGSKVRGVPQPTARGTGGVLVLGGR